MSSGPPKTPIRGTSAESTASSTDFRNEIADLQDLFDNYSRNPDQLLQNSRDQIQGLCLRVATLLKDKEEYPSNRTTYELNPKHPLSNNAQLLANSLFYCTKNPGGIQRYAAEGSKYNQIYKQQKPTEEPSYLQPSDSCDSLEKARTRLLKDIEERPFHLSVHTRAFLRELEPWTETTKKYIADRDKKVDSLRSELEYLQTEINKYETQIDQGNITVRDLETQVSRLKEQLKGEEETTTQLQRLNEQKDQAYQALGNTHRRTKSLLEEAQLRLKTTSEGDTKQDPETPLRVPTVLKPGKSPRRISSPAPIALRSEEEIPELSRRNWERQYIENQGRDAWNSLGQDEKDDLWRRVSRE